MKPVSVNNYLNIENNWTKRILGFDSFQKKRDINQIESEYNKDKYGKLKTFDLETIEAYKVKEIALSGLAQDDEIIVSFEEDLYKTTVSQARAIFYNLIKSKVEQYASTNICELGCGYGYNLSYLTPNVYGGEYSVNAVDIGNKLGYNINLFNYYNEDDYNFIRSNSTILTVHSIEQIPDASVIIKHLSKHKHKIEYVIHFEPTFITERKSLIGIFRNKYIKLNDYNRNLSELLNRSSEIEIIESTVDVFGLNPLNSSNVFVWKFK